MFYYENLDKINKYLKIIPINNTKLYHFNKTIAVILRKINKIIEKTVCQISNRQRIHLILIREKV